MTSELIELAGTQIGARRLGLITSINDNAVRAGSEVSTKPFEQDHEDYRQDWHVMQSDLRWMDKIGWIMCDESAAGIDGVLIQSDGVEVARAFKSAREDVAARVKVARENYLRWLYNCDHNEESRITYDDFRANALGVYLGKEFTDKEIRRAAQWLVDGSYITGQRMQTGSYSNPQITNDGSDVIDRYGSLADTPASPQGNVTTHISLADSHGNNLNVGGSNVSQSTNVTVEQLKEATKFIGSAKGLVPLLDLSAQDQARALEAISQLELETTGPAPKQGRVKELIAKVTEIAALGTAQGMVDALVSMGETAMAGFGG
ncbi:hypothetical protein [Paeniglutamicibacter sulfureus]|uniref:Uncharacterized protein n=1 Tax=Paeniglutamicibacter sulfureus TaxID=43666 RepID=A0ABU2BEJ1_9MICC|nr:hypothetical protein [Paeniglutamicibacter sulfureus]MDR7356384.1 hypothetical protein [Paeniglutamicibacter sulfureus]